MALGNSWRTRGASLGRIPPPPTSRRSTDERLWAATAPPWSAPAAEGTAPWAAECTAATMSSSMVGTAMSAVTWCAATRRTASPGEYLAAPRAGGGRGAGGQGGREGMWGEQAMCAAAEPVTCVGVWGGWSQPQAHPSTLPPTHAMPLRITQPA